jgi:hypothetical protein
MTEPVYSALVVEEKPTVAKAVVAATGALTTGLTTALADGQVTIWEVVLTVLFTIGTTAAVWATTNKP